MGQISASTQHISSLYEFDSERFSAQRTGSTIRLGREWEHFWFYYFFFCFFCLFLSHCVAFVIFCVFVVHAMARSFVFQFILWRHLTVCTQYSFLYFFSHLFISYTNLFSSSNKEPEWVHQSKTQITARLGWLRIECAKFVSVFVCVSSRSVARSFRQTSDFQSAQARREHALLTCIKAHNNITCRCS